MNRAFISPLIYAEVFAQKKRRAPQHDQVQQIKMEFEHSPYDKILLPYSWLENFENLSNHFQEIIWVARPWEFQNSNVSIPARTSLIILVDKINDISEACRLYPAAIEIVFWAQSPLTQENLDKIPQDPRLRWLFSYNISHTDLEKSLVRLKKSQIVAQASDFLELSPETSLQSWYSPRLVDLQKSHQTTGIEMSIIVPFQDNYDEILLTLPCLFQSLAKETQTEIIVANDSFELDQEKEVLSVLRSQPLPFTYFRVERKASRLKGDSQFRAGVVRNMAYAHAQGKELVFLDSDILVTAELWSSIRSAREQNQGPLMPRRHFLRSDLKIAEFAAAKWQVGFHTQLSWGGHWEDFYRNPVVMDSWRWTSTYCLAIPKKAFAECGGFGRAFSTYGFEDTDLGYRLFKLGLKLEILKQDVFHLPFQTSRSEYSSHFEKRKEVLRRSFGAFYRSTLLPDLHSQFHHILY